jgi:hypothetical protein
MVMNKPIEVARVPQGTISEVIAVLEKLKERHGDLFVEYPTDPTIYSDGGRGPESELVSVLTVYPMPGEARPYYVKIS